MLDHEQCDDDFSLVYCAVCEACDGVVVFGCVFDWLGVVIDLC